jgi:hypothetical protein
MDLFTTLAMITKHTLGLLESKEARKYIDQILELERMKRDEMAKPKNKWNHALLDNIDAELCLIANTTAALSTKTPAN